MRRNENNNNKQKPYHLSRLIAQIIDDNTAVQPADIAVCLILCTSTVLVVLYEVMRAVIQRCRRSSMIHEYSS